MRYIISLLLSILPQSANADVPRVITDIPPVYGLTQQVMGDLGAPTLLLAKGADEHDFQLRPSQMGDIAAADLLVWIGPELTPWLDRALGGGKAGLVSLPLLDQDKTFVQAYSEPNNAQGHAEHDHDAKHDHDEHAHEGADPHAWMDPENAILWLGMIADALADLDNANAAIYRANAAAAQSDIRAMDAEIAARLAPLRDRAFVTYHDAYGYLIGHYGLNFSGSVALGDATTAGAAHIRALQDTIAKDVVCVFPEAQHDSDLLLQLLDGTNARAGAPLDPVGSTLDANGQTYRTLMLGLTENIAACLEGA